MESYNINSDTLMIPQCNLTEKRVTDRKINWKQPLISIITINYRNSYVTNQMLASLRNLTWKNFEVIIVDNSLTDDFKNIDYSGLTTRLIVNHINNGFAGGNNLGIRHSKGDYILLLNNDTEVSPGFIEPLVELFLHEKNVGAVSPKIKYFYEPNRIQYAGFTRMNPFTLRMEAIGSKQPDDGRFDKIIETPYAHGCAMMVSRKALLKVGLMPEEYILYYEEHDWSTQIRKAGYKIFFQPRSVVFHKESLSVRKDSPLKTYFLNRNRILFMVRNFNPVLRLLSSVYLAFVSIPVNMLKYLAKKEFKHYKAYLDAVLWNINHQTKPQWKL